MRSGGENRAIPAVPSASLTPAAPTAPAPKKKKWAPMAMECAVGEVEVRPKDGYSFKPKDFEVFADKSSFRISIPGRLHPAAMEGLACFTPSQVADRELADQLRGGAFGGRWWVDSECEEKLGGDDRAEAVCDAMIKTVESGAELSWVDWTYYIAMGGTAVGALGLTGTWAVFGPGMTYWNEHYQRKQVEKAEKGKDPDDKDPPAPPPIPMGQPGAASKGAGAADSAAMSAFEAGVLTAAGYTFAKAKAMTDTTEGKVVLGAAVGIGILATLPVSVPSLMLYGGSSAMFSLVDMNVIKGSMEPQDNEA